MADLQKVADQGTPLLRDLGRAAPQLDRLIRGLGTLSQAGRESLPSLGDALERGLPALNRARPLFRDLTRLGRQAEPVSEDLDDLTASLDRTGGVERINDFLYYLSLNLNGFDSIGHYLRAGLVVNECSSYATEPVGPPCNATFGDTGVGAVASLAARNAPAPKGGEGDGSVAPRGTLLSRLLGPAEKPAQTRQREAGLRRLRERAARGSRALSDSEPALDYLLGSDR
jgi:phospholipid/cholesterol/gamma-HCH transport system substrate-binding protein